MHGTSLKHQKSVIMCSWLSSAHHYRKSRFCRVRQGLPSANSLAHDKHKFCRVYSRKHTTKSKHTAKSCFAMCFFVTHGKEYFAVCFFVTHGKAKLCRVFYFGTQQSNKIFCLLTSKLFLHFTYNMWYSMLKFDTFLYLFVIFN